MAKIIPLPTAAKEPVQQYFGTRWRGRYPRDVVPSWRICQKRIGREQSRTEVRPHAEGANRVTLGEIEYHRHHIAMLTAKLSSSEGMAEGWWNSLHPLTRSFVCGYAETAALEHALAYRLKPDEGKRD